MPLSTPQKLFDLLLELQTGGADARGWTTDANSSRPSVTVTSEVMIALIDAAAASAVIVPGDFTSRLKQSAVFICEDIKKRSKDNTLDLGNYIRALSAYLFYAKYVSTPTESFNIDRDFIEACTKGIKDTFKPTGTLIDKWLYINGCKDLLDAAPDQFRDFQTPVQLAQGQLAEHAKGATLSSYDAATVLDALLPRRLATNEKLSEIIDMNVVEKCVQTIVDERRDEISALVATTREDEYRVYTPAFVIRSFAMLRASLDETARRFSYRLITSVHGNLEGIDKRFRLAHLLRAFIHAGIQPEDAEYINSLLKTNEELRRQNVALTETKLPQTDVEALTSAQQRRLIYVGEPTSTFFAAFSAPAYFGSFGILLVVFYTLLRSSTTRQSFIISLGAIIAMVIFIAYQAHIVDKNLRAKPVSEKGHSVMLFFVMTVFYILSALGFLLKADHWIIDQFNKLQ